MIKLGVRHPKKTSESSELLVCNNGGGGGNISKSKAVISKAQRNTEIVILRGFLFFAVPRRDFKFRNARNFSQNLFYP